MFVGVTSGLAASAALPLSGCIGGGDELGYRNWMPASFDPSGMYVDVPAVRDNTSLFEGSEGSTQYGLSFDDISEIVGTSDAEVIETSEGAEPEVEGDEIGEYQGFTVYDAEGSGYVASDEDTVIEARQRYAVTSVIDASLGNVPRLHEEDAAFEDVTSAAGAGELVIVPSENARTGDAGLEAKAAVFEDEGVRVTYAVALSEADAEQVEEAVNGIDGVSVSDSSEQSSGEVLVLSLDVEEDRLLGFFGLGRISPRDGP